MLVAGGLLLALCLPVLGMQTALPGTDTLPRSLPVMQTYDRIQAAFPGKEIAATVAVQCDAALDAGRQRGDRRTAQTRARERRRQRADHGRVARDGRVAAVDLPIDGDGADAASQRALDVIRGELTPALRADLPPARPSP